MSEVSWPGLRALLIQRYDDLKTRLTRTLGSDDLASEALQDLWLRLHQNQDRTGTVEQPVALLMRMGVNLAVDRVRSEQRYLSVDAIEALADELVDPAAGPARTVEARQQWEHLARVIDQLPPQRREILLALRLGDASLQETADRFGISLRQVSIELKKAHEYCAKHMLR